MYSGCTVNISTLFRVLKPTNFISDWPVHISGECKSVFFDFCCRCTVRIYEEKWKTKVDNQFVLEKEMVLMKCKRKPGQVVFSRSLKFGIRLNPVNCNEWRKKCMKIWRLQRNLHFVGHFNGDYLQFVAGKAWIM